MVTILEIFAELLGDAFGKAPCYNTVENRVKKPGLSVYQDDQPCKDKKSAMVVDGSIAINGRKLLLPLGVPSGHQERPLRHEDVTVLDMSVSKSFNGDDVQDRIEAAEKSAGSASDYIITLLGKKRLQYHLTDKAYLLPPNMRAISRFMNMSSWGLGGNEMLNCYDALPEKMQETYAFIKDYESLLRELQTVICAVRHVEAICKNEGFSIMTSRKCKSYIITHVLGNEHYRQVRVGIEMIEYFKREEAPLTDNRSINLSSDIIESTFGSYKSKMSPNKLYGVTFSF